MSILELFCSVDEFWVRFEPMWRREALAARPVGKRTRRRRGELHPSEIMTILIWFHHAHYRTFKAYYTEHVRVHLRGEFPHLVSYQRFVALMPSVLLPLTAYLHAQLGACTGIGFVDSTALAVCHPARITRHRVFRADAARGKTSVGWFYGFKLHLVVNDRGELLAFCLTRGNVDDRTPVLGLLGRVKGLRGRVFGDKGYISQPLAEELLVGHGVRLITRLRKNMRNRLMDVFDKLLLRKRALIETINDQLKNVCQIEHTRHRSPLNFLVNLVGGLIAYCHLPKKPSLHLDPDRDLPALAPSSLIQN
jgi:Transposase DDE domain